MKNKKGITLISLIITIVVLSILASIATYSGLNVIKSSKMTAFTTELKIMQTHVNAIYQENANGEYGEEINHNATVKEQADKVFTNEESGIESYEGYRYWSQEYIKEELKIEGVEQSFFVNLSQRKIVSYEGLEYERKRYYTLEQLPNGLYNVEYQEVNEEKPTFDMKAENIGNEKWRITIFNIQYHGNAYINKWQVAYRTEDKTYWNTTNDLSFVVNQAGIYVVQISNGTIQSEEKSVYVMGKVNEPDISGFNKSSTYYVAWDLNEAETEYVPNEVVMQDGTPPNNWYDYKEGVNHWANVKTTGGENECYWVWIPRYAYKVPTKGNTAETIEVKFLRDTSNEPIDGSSITISNNTAEGNWNVHPAFWWDNNNNGEEEEGEQLTGIWVAKYEASSSAVNAIQLENETLTGDIDSLNGNGGGTDTSLQVRVKPNVTSWRNITVGNIFTVCRNLTASGNSLEGTSGIDSHMMKNTEWGAVAYLSRSVYGKNGEVWNNPYYNNTTNYSPITGLCSNETDGKDKGMTDITKTCKYNEAGGGNASTTGNVYGVYDMAGGAWEYVAGILSSYKSKSGNYDFTNSDTYPNKYFDWYVGNSSDRNTNYNGNANKYGDAVFETSSSGVSDTGSWDSSYSYFPPSSYPVFKRGGLASNGSFAGVFAFDYYAGEAYTGFSFRPVVLSSQP